jgi:hypothetical protein
VIHKLLGDGPRQCHGPDAFARLGRSHDDLAADIRRCSADANEAPERIEVTKLEAGEFPDTKPSEGTDEDEFAVARIDHVGQVQNLVHGERDRLSSLDLRQLDISGGGESDQSVTYGQSENAGGDLPSLLDRCR